MAELAAFIGVAASVVGIASEGVKLSQTLNTYIAKVKYADRDVSGIANDVKETATVLVQLGDNLKLEEQSMICKPEFYETTNENVTSCEKIFKEIEAALSELVNIVVDEKGGPRSVELKSKVRFKWPFKRTQFTLLRTDLDRLKANLGLMISVMRHARELHEKEILDKQNAIGRRIETLKIQTLELETEAAEARFHDVKRRAEMAKEHLKSQQNVDDDDVEDCIDGATLNEDIERDGLNSSQQQPIPVVPMNGLTGQDYLPPPDRGTLGHGATNLAKTNLQTGMGNADSNEGPRPETANPSHKNRSYVEAATDWSKLEGLLVRIATAQEILAGSPESSVHQRQSKSRKRSDLQVHNHVKGRISGRPSDHQNKRSGKELPRASSEDDTDLQPGESGDNSSRNGSRSSDVRPETGNLPIEEKVTKIPGSPYKPSLAGSEVPSKASQACLLVLGLPSSPNAAEHYSSEYDTENHLKGSPLTHSESGSPTWGNVKAANDVRRNSADQEARGISRQKEGKDRVKYHQDEETVLPVDEMPIVLRKSDKRPFSRVEKGKWREGDDYHFGGAATKVSDDEAKTLRIIELSHEQKPAEGYVMQEKVCGINREGNQRTEQSTDVDPREVKLPMTDDQADSEVVDLKRRDSQAPPQQVSSDPDVLVVSSIKSRGRWKNRFVRMRNKSKLLPARLLPSSDTQQGDAIEETKSTGNSIRETIEGNMAQPAQQPPIVDGSAASPENMVNDSRSPGTLPHGPHLPSRATHHLSTPLGVDPSNPAGLHQPIYHEQFEIGNVANLVVPPIPLVYNPAQDHLRILEAWVFRRADILKQSKDWGNVSRNLLPLDPQELNETVSNQEKKGNKIWESFSVLSSYQQRQIQLLLYDKHCQFDHSSPNSVNRFVWTLKALKTDPKRAKTVDIRSIQIIIERKMQLGGQSQVTSIPYAPPVPLGHVGNSMQMHPVPRLRSHEASHRQQAHVSFAAEPADISQGPSRRTTYDDDFDRDSFMRRSRDNVKERSSSDTGPWDSQRGNSSSRPSYSENVALGAHAARKSSKEKKRMHKIKESILDLEDEMVDIDHRLEQRFDKLEDKLDKQLALRQTGSPIANRAQNGGLKETKLTSVDGVYYSPAGAPLKALNSQPPLPSPDKFGVTVDSLLSKWTIVEGIHGNTAAPVNNSRVSLQRRSAPYLSSLHKSTTARRPSSRQRLSKSFKDNRQHTESGPRFSDSHMSSSDLIDDMD